MHVCDVSECISRKAASSECNNTTTQSIKNKSTENDNLKVDKNFMEKKSYKLVLVLVDTILLHFVKMVLYILGAIIE